jgi:hypothetical protein
MRFKNIGVNIQSRLTHNQHGEGAVVASLSEAIVAHHSSIAADRYRGAEARSRKFLEIYLDASLILLIIVFLQFGCASIGGRYVGLKQIRVDFVQQDSASPLPGLIRFSVGL